MQKAAIIAIGFLLQILASQAFAYEVNTHQAMSIAAVNASVLSDPGGQLLVNLGLDPNNLGLDPNNPNNKPIQSKTITQWIGYGSIVEDNGLRPSNHFYDPLTGLGLQGVSIPFFTIYASPDWALANTGTISDQRFSFVDARSYLYQALTATNQADHDKYFGLTFQTLGQVIHHIQDMAQPQHVRNDAHCDIGACKLLSRFNPSLVDAARQFLIPRNVKLTDTDNLSRSRV
jgi:hypothetical protein